jgi:antitoxin (DNA-binding transcriptional repressor) of toxin-antitoxin stability system
LYSQIETFADPASFRANGFQCAILYSRGYYASQCANTEKQLLELLEKVQAGEEVTFVKDDKPVAKLSKFKRVPQPGRMKGKIWIADDFDKTDQEIIDSFYNSKIFPDE